MAEATDPSWSAAVAPYRTLIEGFVDGQLSADAFEERFLALYKGDDTLWPDELFDLLDGFFADVDDYSGDPTLRAEVGGMSADDLRRCAKVTYLGLQKWSVDRVG